MELTEKQPQRSLGETLRYYRERCKVSQEFVAGQLEVSRQSVSKWELDLTIPSTNNLIAVSKLLNISIDVLLNARGYYEETSEEGTDCELIEDESEGGDNEATDADTTYKMTKKTKKLIAVVSLVVAAVLLVSAVISVNIHNRNYYSNLLNISEQQLNEFIEAEPSVQKVDIQKNRSMKTSLYNSINRYKSNFLIHFKEDFEVSFTDVFGQYYISRHQINEDLSASDMFLELLSGEQCTKYRTLICSDKSKYSEFVLENKYGSTYIYIWYSGDTFYVLMSETYESGKVIINKLSDYSKEEIK